MSNSNEVYVGSLFGTSKTGTISAVLENPIPITPYHKYYLEATSILFSNSSPNIYGDKRKLQAVIIYDSDPNYSFNHEFEIGVYDETTLINDFNKLFTFDEKTCLVMSIGATTGKLKIVLDPDVCASLGIASITINHDDSILTSRVMNFGLSAPVVFSVGGTEFLIANESMIIQNYNSVMVSSNIVESSTRVSFRDDNTKAVKKSIIAIVGSVAKAFETLPYVATTRQVTPLNVSSSITQYSFTLLDDSGDELYFPPGFNSDFSVYVRIFYVK